MPSGFSVHFRGEFAGFVARSQEFTASSGRKGAGIANSHELQPPSDAFHHFAAAAARPGSAHCRGETGENPSLLFSIGFRASQRAAHGIPRLAERIGDLGDQVVAEQQREVGRLARLRE